MTVDGRTADRSAGEVWAATLARLRGRVDADLVDVWLAPLEPEALSRRILILRAPREIRAWVAERFSRVLDAALQEELGVGAAVEVIGPDTEVLQAQTLIPSAHAPPDDIGLRTTRERHHDARPRGTAGDVTRLRRPPRPPSRPQTPGRD